MTEAQLNNHALELAPDAHEAANAVSDAGLVKFNDAPAADTQQDAELNEMRVIAKRLKALEPAARARVLQWLASKFG